jgi:hypothetical protein
MFPPSSKASTSHAIVAFPDVCKTPAPPAPFVPVPYPNDQYQENLKAANKVDAMTKTGNKEAQQKQKQAIDNLFNQTGIRAPSATQAVMLGKTAHGTQANKTSTVQQQSRNATTVSNASRSHHEILASIINNIRA